MITKLTCLYFCVVSVIGICNAIWYGQSKTPELLRVSVAQLRNQQIVNVPDKHKLSCLLKVKL